MMPHGCSRKQPPMMNGIDIPCQVLVHITDSDSTIHRASRSDTKLYSDTSAYDKYRGDTRQMTDTITPRFLILFVLCLHLNPEYD